MKDRIEKGKKVTEEAIAKKDVVALQSCIKTFLDMGAPPEAFSEAIQSCPIGLFEKTGYTLTIFSNVAGRNVVFGKDVSWEAVRGLIEIGAGDDTLKMALSAQELLGGEVVSAEKVQQVELFAGGGTSEEH